MDRPELESRGFEAWRLLNKHYAPKGGAYQMEMMQAIPSQKPVKDAAAIPGAVIKFERDLLKYQEQTGVPCPEEWKVPTFLKLLPRAQEQELKLKYAQGLTDYKVLTEHLVTFGHQARQDGAYSRGDNDFDLGVLSWSQLSEEELEVYCEGIAAGAAGEPETDEPIRRSFI